jgi:hypothetical protein
MNMTVGYLGKPCDQSANFQQMLRSAGMRVSVLADSSVHSAAESASRFPGSKQLRNARSRVSRLRRQICGETSKAYMAALLRQLDEDQVECIIGFWGTNLLGDIAAIKRARPRMRVYLNVLCHPTALSAAKVAAQNWLFRKHVRHCDGLLVSSVAMQTYLQKNVLPGAEVPCHLWPPYLAEAYHPRQRLADCAQTPNVLFMGRMDWWRGQPSDNVTALLGSLSEQGTHVFHHASPRETIAHPFRHTFDYMPLPEAVEYATQFDASLIAYNLDACGRTDRFSVTVPDRLVASVAAGIPIALPETGFEACREYLRDYQAVISYTSPESLSEQLRDRARVAELKTMALRNSAQYIAERCLGDLLQFIGVREGVTNFERDVTISAASPSLARRGIP